MAKYSILDSRYEGLSTNEKIRQVERDNLLAKQTEELEEQNRLRRQEIEAQQERENERRVLEIRRQMELEEQTKIQKERFFIDNLSELDKERYKAYKQTLDDVNRTLNQINDLEYTYINNKQKLISSFQISLNKAKNIGSGRLIIITFITFVALFLYYVIVSIRSSISSNMIVISCFGAIFFMIANTIIYMIKHHKTNKKVASINKDIKKLAKEIDKLGLTDNIETIEYIHQVGFEGVTRYATSVEQCVKDVLSITNKLESEMKEIKDGINEITDILNSIYKKNRKMEE